VEGPREARDRRGERIHGMLLIPLTLMIVFLIAGIQRW
jgi:hypothetical protein